MRSTVEPSPSTSTHIHHFEVGSSASIGQLRTVVVNRAPRSVSSMTRIRSAWPSVCWLRNDIFVCCLNRLRNEASISVSSGPITMAPADLSSSQAMTSLRQRFTVSPIVSTHMAR